MNTAVLPDLGVRRGLSQRRDRLERRQREHQDALRLGEMRRYWSQVWAAVGLDQHNLPALHDFVDQPTEHSGGFIRRGEFRKLLFGLPAGMVFAEAEDVMDRVADTIGRRMLVVRKSYAFSGGRDAPGARKTVFTLEHELEELGEAPHLDGRLDAATFDFAVRWALTSAMRPLGHGPPEFVNVERFTSEGPALAAASFKARPGVTVEELDRSASQLRQWLECDYLRFFRPAGGARHVGMVFGAHLAETSLRHPRRHLVNRLNAIDWAFWMRAAGPTDGDTAPAPTHIRDPHLDVQRIEFSCPPGVTAETVRSALPRLRALSGQDFLEMHDDFTPGESFTLLAGSADPLERVFLFADDRDWLLRDSTKGQPRTSWAAGVTRTGERLTLDWGVSQPHLVIAGAPGSGKTTLMASMLCQLMHNNDPDDVNVWICADGHGLRAFEDCDHVTRYCVPSDTGTGPLAVVEAMLAEAAALIDQRRSATGEHTPDGDTRADIAIVAEESKWLRPPDPTRAAPDEHSRLLGLLHDVIRRGPEAGVYLVMGTQHPDVASCLQRHSRLIGLPMSAPAATRTVIGQADLVDLAAPGRAVLADNDGLTHFRGFQFAAADAAGERPDGITEMLSLLPRSSGRDKRPAGLRPAASGGGRRWKRWAYNWSACP